MTREEIAKRLKLAFPSLQDNSPELGWAIRGFEQGLKTEDISSENFFLSLAKSLRELWPAGEKDGKYSWRDSVGNLQKRLEFLWKERNLGTKYSLDDCLVAARRYLAQFENNVKYMQVLKYFIFKQTRIVASDGKITYIYKSSFADLLENNSFRQQDDWNGVFESSNTVEQGELI